jgi:hypothetical protein
MPKLQKAFMLNNKPVENTGDKIMGHRVFQYIEEHDPSITESTDTLLIVDNKGNVKEVLVIETGCGHNTSHVASWESTPVTPETSGQIQELLTIDNRPVENTGNKILGHPVYQHIDLAKDYETKKLLILDCNNELKETLSITASCSADNTPYICAWGTKKKTTTVDFPEVK